ncbi:MAG: fumarylacetoacetate hydrolase [Acidobacteria bacterium]|nr:MAG: fumarylacetoacetate hydrolase [Acidobacteriota bacterium]
MRFVNADGRSGLLVADQVFDLAEASGGAISADPTEAVFANWDAALRLSQDGALSGGRPVDNVQLGPPIPRPRAIFGIGLNFRKHAEESGMGVPDVPPVFTKFPTSICGPFDDIVLPAGHAETVDWEAELAFVVGSGGKKISREAAWDSIAGLTVAQDISERTLQMAGARQFSMGKSFDTFCPIGPAIVSLDEITDPSDLRITCKLNGKVVQDESTSDMVFDIPELVAFLSSVLPLRPGDLCLTGTPSGVGMGMNPKVYLRDGDVIDTEIAGIGGMRNRCVPEA